MNILVIIDMQNDFITGSLANKAAEAIVPSIVDEIRPKETMYAYNEIILTRDTHGYDYLKTNEGKHLPVPHCINGTEGWLVDKRIRDALDSVSGYCPIDYLDKNTFGTYNWIKYIRQDHLLGSDLNITLCGTCTDICVISNALILKAMYPEANIKVIQNCCAGLTPEKHKAALEVMRSCQIKVSEVK